MFADCFGPSDRKSGTHALTLWPLESKDYGVSALDDAPHAVHRDVILLADASPEGLAIAAALRTQGFAVATSTIERLEASVVEESPRVLIVLQPASVSQAPLRWLDEFGSNSSDCEWSPKEMLRMALRAQGDGGRVVERGLRLKSALQSPADSAGFDVVIDLRIGGTVAVKK